MKQYHFPTAAELYHYGVKGMKWGVRRTPEQLGHIKKGVAKSQKSSIMKTEGDLAKQKTSSLRKGIRSLSKKIALHEDKIKNPKKYYEDWDLRSEKEKNGDIRHWKKEIKNYQDSINYRIRELRKRGYK